MLRRLDSFDSTPNKYERRSTTREDDYDDNVDGQIKFKKPFS
jgi:hypothetical protein